MDEQQYIHIAGITFIISADKPLQIDIFSDKLQGFAQGFPGEDSVVVRYHYSLPPFSVGKTDKLVYDQAPWQVYESSEGWNYLGITGDPLAPMFQMATIDSGYRTIDVYFPDKTLFEHHKLQSIALIPTDQIILAPILAERQACIVHSAGLIFNGAGLLFVGHSEAGKSTMVKLLRDESEILCDDRIILRRWPDGIKIHGTWSHGEIPDVSPASAPLRALIPGKSAAQRAGAYDPRRGGARAAAIRDQNPGRARMVDEDAGSGGARGA